MKISHGLGVVIVAALACKSPSKTTIVSGENITVSKKKEMVKPSVAVSSVPASTERKKVTIDPIQSRYAVYLNTLPENITNIQLYQFIDRWLHTPYKWGGTDENGIDCSAFLQRLFAEVYYVRIPRTSVEQFFTNNVDKFRSKDFLSEGDLVFFHTISDRPISHVGLYLQNGMFVNSSSSKGVSIASLNDPYWKKRYVAAGRLKNF